MLFSVACNQCCWPVNGSDLLWSLIFISKVFRYRPCISHCFQQCHSQHCLGLYIFSPVSLKTMTHIQEIGPMKPSLILLRVSCTYWIQETHLFWCQKVKGQGHEPEKHYRRGSLHSCECWLFLVSDIEQSRATGPETEHCVSVFWRTFLSVSFRTICELENVKTFLDFGDTVDDGGGVWSNDEAMPLAIVVQDTFKQYSEDTR